VFYGALGNHLVPEAQAVIAVPDEQVRPNEGIEGTDRDGKRHHPPLSAAQRP
jgi:hypothetical protein